MRLASTDSTTHWLPKRRAISVTKVGFAVAAVLIGLGLEVFVVIWRAGAGFDLQAYGIGIGGLLLAAGGALKLKESTEPTDTTTLTQKTETTVSESK